MKYSNCTILAAERYEPAKFIGTNKAGEQEEVTTPPLLSAVEIPDCAHTMLLVTENGIYACGREAVA